MNGLLARSPAEHAAAVARLLRGPPEAFDQAIGDTTLAGMDLPLDLREHYGTGWQVVHPAGFLDRRLPARAWRELAALRVVAAAPEGTRAASLRGEVRRVLLRYPTPGVQQDDVGWLAALPLDELVLSNMDARGFNALGGLGRLRSLWLSWCTIDAPVEALGHLRLRSLRLDSVTGRVGDLTAMVAVRRLEVSHAQGLDLHGFRCLATEVRIGHGVDGEQTARLLAGLPNLRDLEVDDSDRPPDLSGVPTLASLRFERPRFADLAGMPAHVQRLYVRFGGLQSLVGVEQMPGLRVLGLYYCRRLRDLDPLADHPSLAVIDLRGVGGLTDGAALERVPGLAAVAIAGSGLSAEQLPVHVRDRSPTAMQVDMDKLERTPAPARPAGPTPGSARALVESADFDAIDVGVDALVEGGAVDDALPAVVYERPEPDVEGVFDFVVPNGYLLAKGRRYSSDPSGRFERHARRALLARCGPKHDALRAAVTSLRIDGGADRVDLGPLLAFPNLRELVIDGATELRGEAALADLPVTRLRLFGCPPVHALPRTLELLDVASMAPAGVPPLAPGVLASAPGLTSLRMLAPLQPSWLPDLAEVPNLARYFGSAIPSPLPALHTLRLERADLLDDDSLRGLLALPSLRRLSLQRWPAGRSLDWLTGLDLRVLQVLVAPGSGRPAAVALPDLPGVERLSVTATEGPLDLRLGGTPSLRHLQVSGRLPRLPGVTLRTLHVHQAELERVPPTTWAMLRTLVVQLSGSVQELELPAHATPLALVGVFDHPDRPGLAALAVLSRLPGTSSWGPRRPGRLPADLRVC